MMNRLRFPPEPTPVSTARPFATETQATLVALSAMLLKDRARHGSNALTALGFWLRRANLAAIAQEQGAATLRPLGSVLHFTPANVDVVFLYLAFLSVLAGNHNRVRLSGRAGVDAAFLIQCLQELWRDPVHRPTLARLVLFQSAHDDPELREYAATADGRVIWGSNAAIAAIRQALPLAAQAREWALPHKHSLCLLRAVMVTPDIVSELAQRFVRDAFDYDQQACSSPRTVIWLGEPADVAAAQELFWRAVEMALADAAFPALDNEGRRATLPFAATAMARLSSAQRLAMTTPCAGLTVSGALARLAVTGLIEAQEALHEGHGVFLEWAIRDLAELVETLRPWHQTLTFFGWERSELVDWATDQNVRGLDRIEPVGQALMFQTIWDGVDAVGFFTRKLRTSLDREVSL